MSDDKTFYLDSPLAIGLRELFVQLENRLQLESTLKVYLAGGMAVHLYTAERVTTDVDAEFGGRVHIPNDLFSKIELEDKSNVLMYFDTNYNSTFSLLHEDYLDDSLEVDLKLKFIKLRVLSPLDLAVSKIARFQKNDREDIASLVRLGLTSSEEIEKRALGALNGFVGGSTMLKLNIRDAVELARGVELQSRFPRLG